MNDFDKAVSSDSAAVRPQNTETRVTGLQNTVQASLSECLGYSNSQDT